MVGDPRRGQGIITGAQCHCGVTFYLSNSDETLGSVHRSSAQLLGAALSQYQCIAFVPILLSKDKS